MKKLLLFCCIMLIIHFLHAQIALVAPQLQTQSYGFKGKIAHTYAVPSDTSVNLNNKKLLQNALKQLQTTVDNMPVAGAGEVNLTLRGNNNQGFMVYSATPDNMPVIKPDATFYSAMPTVGNKSTTQVIKP